jgi:hypothetical protein
MTRLADLKQQFQALASSLTFDSLDQECDLTVVHGDKRLLNTWENALRRLQMFVDEQSSVSADAKSDDETVDVQTIAEPTAPVCEQSEPKGNMSSSRLTILKVKQMIRELFETDEDYKRWLYLGSVGNRRLIKPWVNFYIRTQKLISMAGSNALSAIREADSTLTDRELSEEALAITTEAIEKEHQCAAHRANELVSYLDRAETSNDETIDVRTSAEPTAPVLDYSNDEPFDVEPTDEASKPWKYRNNGIIPRRVLRRGNAFIRNLRCSLRSPRVTNNGKQQHTRDSKDRHNRIPFYAQPYDLRGTIQRQPMQVHFRNTEEGYGLSLGEAMRYESKLM